MPQVDHNAGEVPPGRVPRHKSVILVADLVDAARPGEEVDVTGIYVHSYDFSLAGPGFPIFSTTIEANHVAKKNTTKSNVFSEEDKRSILRLSRNPQVHELIVSSLAPSIYGLPLVKRALVMAMFGGCSKNVDGKHRVRGDVFCRDSFQ